MSENTEIIFDQAEVEKNKGIAIVMAIFPILFFLVFCVDSAKNSAYAKKIANSSLLLIILDVAISVVAIIPVLGLIVSGIAGVARFVFWIMNIVNAAKANGKSLPLIGGIEIIK